MREWLARAAELFGRQARTPPVATPRHAPPDPPTAAKADARHHPYRDLDERAHWRLAVDGRPPLAISDWYRKRFDISEMRIATAGSCFAQHIGREMKRSGFRFLDVEPPPAVMERQSLQAFGFDIYSARYGNIYTSRQLLQLVLRAFGEFQPMTGAWEHAGGFVDPFRPTLEPRPFESLDELAAHREHHLGRVRALIAQTDLFVFTMGLTETFVSAEDGAAYPVAPGVAGGAYAPELHRFLNLGYEDVLADMEALIARLRAVKPDMHFLFTVSPVPLMATVSGQHVVAATSYSKAVLRAVAGWLYERHAFVDYFPSFEIVNAHVMKGAFYAPNGRDVISDGVAHVMAQFLGQHPPPADATSARKPANVDDDEKVVCDEELIAAFR